MLGLKENVKEELKKKQYGLFSHSSVQICSWTKKALTNKGVCYKQKFYGIECYRCMQFTPLAAFCNANCIFCWRPMELMMIKKLKEKEVENPKDIVENLISERKKLLSGFGGNKKVNKEMLKRAMQPSHYAISLMGEPLLYPKLPELVKYLKQREGTKTIFIVSNGLEPKALKKLSKDKALPTQLYISVNAPNKNLFNKIERPYYEDGWDRFLETLKLLKRLKTRTVLRVTIIKGFNMFDKYINDYAKLVKLADPDFIEVKAYMHIGYSRKRLNKENMPEHDEVKDYAIKLAKKINFEVINECKESRIVLLKNKEKNKEVKIIKDDK